MKTTFHMKLFKDDNVYYNISKIEGIKTIEENKTIGKFTFENIENTFEVDTEGCIFKRENDEFTFTLNTSKKEATYLLKETNSLLNIQVEKCEFFNLENKWVLKYQLETDDNLNTIEIIQGE